MILIPLFMPLAKDGGMVPIHFAVFALAVLGISLVTPPLGTACFVVTGIAGTSMQKLFKPMLPFIAILIVTMLLLAYVPGLSLWLPGLSGEG